jgi:uncharacterized protein (TIGR00304 family)
VTIPEGLYLAGFGIVLIGIGILALAIFLLSAKSKGKGNVKGGGVVIIGPVPIVFGTDKKSVKTVLLLSIVLTVLLLITFIVGYILMR